MKRNNNSLDKIFNSGVDPVKPVNPPRPIPTKYPPRREEDQPVKRQSDEKPSKSFKDLLEEEIEKNKANSSRRMNMRKPIKSDITDVDYDAWRDTVPYEQSYEKEFDDMVEEWGYDVNDRFTYMAGIRPEDWEQKDTDSAAAFHVDVAGYYILGDQEGMVLVGTLKDIYDYCDNYWGMGLHPDYVCPADSFDYEDGEWVTGGWIDSSRRPIKSSTTNKELQNDYEYFTEDDVTGIKIFLWKKSFEQMKRFF